jgi:hypothetical protein
MPALKWKKQSSGAIDERALKDYADKLTKVRLIPSEDKVVVIEVTGPCPVCRHEFPYEYPLVSVSGIEVVTTEQLIQLADSIGQKAGDEDVVITCACEDDHPGKETENQKESGCGARWSLRVSWGER